MHNTFFFHLLLNSSYCCSDLQQALTALPTGIWWTALYPGLAMFVLVLGLSFLGEGLESWLSGNDTERNAL